MDRFECEGIHQNEEEQGAWRFLTYSQFELKKKTQKSNFEFSFSFV